MSDAFRHLAMYLAGPMQAWGHASRYDRRTTLAHPTRSGITGLLMAALGAPRDDTDTLTALAELAMEVLIFAAPGRPAPRWSDFHTVGGGFDADTQRDWMPRKASGAKPGTVVTRREYLADARFGVIIAGEPDLLECCHVALVNPRWGLWLGRKACIPAEPIAHGMHGSRAAALSRLEEVAGCPALRCVREVEAFRDGTDSLMDVPLNFQTRQFTLRRVRVDDPAAEG